MYFAIWKGCVEGLDTRDPPWGLSVWGLFTIPKFNLWDSKLVTLRGQYSHSKGQLPQLAGAKRVGNEAEVRNPRLQDLLPMIFSCSLHLRLADQAVPI